MKTTTLTINTLYPLKKIRRIRVYLTQHLRREDLYAVSRRNPYAVLDYKLWNILEYNNHGAHVKKPQYAVLISFNMAYRPNSRIAFCGLDNCLFTGNLYGLARKGGLGMGRDMGGRKNVKNKDTYVSNDDATIGKHVGGSSSMSNDDIVSGNKEDTRYITRKIHDTERQMLEGIKEKKILFFVDRGMNIECVNEGIGSPSTMIMNVESSLNTSNAINTNVRAGLANNPNLNSTPSVVGPKVGFKPNKKVYRPVSQKNGASTSGKKKQAELSRQKASNLNLFDALNLVENDDELGSNRGNSKVANKGLILAWFTLLATAKNVDYASVNFNSDSDLKVAYDKTAQFMANGGSNDASLYEDEDYDIYNIYDIIGLMKQELAFCDMMDINLHGRSRR
ncbi:hypothetical protein Tco_0968410 [Tanacetum coccineum]